MQHLNVSMFLEMDCRNISLKLRPVIGSLFSLEWQVINVQVSSTDGGQAETEQLTMLHRAGVALITGIYSGHL